MREPAAFDQGLRRRVVGCRAPLPQYLGKFVGQAADGNRPEPFTVVKFEAALRDIAEAMRLLQDGIENRREVAGRRIDDLKYLGGRSLLLQGFARFGDEPRILHCDNRMRWCSGQK